MKKAKTNHETTVKATATTRKKMILMAGSAAEGILQW